jgi:CubicO group peptidase (beta-lactamase class C family)
MNEALKRDAWLKPAIDYVDGWIAFQMRQFDQPGCSIAISQGQTLAFEKSFGVADLNTGELLTERHRFRVASHSKTFTAAGILKLKDEGRLRLDDCAGSFVNGLNPRVASVTIGQLLSHSAGLTRDGPNGGQFSDQRPFLSKDELLGELGDPAPIEAGVRYKYSNHGFGLLGLIIEAVTLEPYDAWIMREIIRPAGLTETTPDMPADGREPFARGHTARLPLGRRAVIPGDNKTNGMMSATGFVSTASDLVRFFSQLLPSAQNSVLSSESRRDMTRPHWRDRESALGRSYGLGVHYGQIGPWDYFGHLGRFQGSLTRTAVLPGTGLAISVLTNANDGQAAQWLDGIVHILRRFRENAAPTPEAEDWNGRWWNMWGAVDLVAVGSKIEAFSPALYPPFSEASEVTLTGADSGLVTRAPATDRFGEAVRRVRGSNGTVTEIWIGGSRFFTEEALKFETLKRYGRGEQ